MQEDDLEAVSCAAVSPGGDSGRGSEAHVAVVP
jgi:hypothetical protein